MRITFVLPAFARAPVGGFKVVYEYANRLVRKGYRVTVLHHEPLAAAGLRWPAWKSCARRWVVEWIERTRPRWIDLDARVETRLVPDLEPHRLPDADILVATAWQTADVTARAPRRCGSGVYLVQGYEVWSGEGETVDATWSLPLHKVVISRWLYDRAVAIGEGGRTTYVPNGIDLNRFRIQVPLTDREPLRVGMMFHENAWKGSADGIEALQRLRQRHPSVTAVVFGTPKRPTRLPGWIKYVRGPKPDALALLYNSCAVFLQASWTEGWGLTATEAMACGCALVTTDNGGSRDYAFDGRTAIVTRPGEPKMLANAVSRFLENHQLRQQIARAGHDQVQSYTWERATDRLEEILKAVA